MVEKLLSLLRKEKTPALGWRGLNEAFMTWKRATHARDIARISADPEKYLRLDLLSAMAWRRYVRRREEIIPIGGMPNCEGLIQ
jgi:hypothetical protein